MTKTTLAESLSDDFLGRLRSAQDQVAGRFPGDSTLRQPVHTVYGGAHLFKADTAEKLGQLAIRALDAYSGEPGDFARAIGLTCDARTANTLVRRVRDKLIREPVEDFRIDFEDGYGHRSDDEEDGHAAHCAREVAKGAEKGTLPPFYGIRIKSLSTAELGRRGLRTMDIFISTLVKETGGTLPGNFVVTLPKITHRDQVVVLDDAIAAIERGLGFETGSIAMELMIETTQSIIGPDGQCYLPTLLEAANGRCTGAHFGTYDYTAGCGVTAAHQHMTHPSCDFARHMMQVAFAGTGIFLSDGATNIMPVGPHKPTPGAPLSDAQIAENRAVVHGAWKLHVEHTRDSLIRGFYQGWDLHPAQLPTRYAAVYDFFLSALEPASQRLENFIEMAAQATLVGDVFDDAATGQGLLNFFVRGLGCGALTEDEALSTGLTLDELRRKSFLEILENRRQAS